MRKAGERVSGIKDQTREVNMPKLIRLSLAVQIKSLFSHMICVRAQLLILKDRK